jgi:muramoyltetrapeptide carboxypeptidase
MEVVIPRCLTWGDKVSVVAPSFSYNPERVEKGLAILRDFGLSPELPPGTDAKEGYFAGPDEHRLSLLERALLEPGTKALFAARGGYGAARLLPRLPYAALRGSPKILVGFSDITALSLGLYAKAGLVTLHGPNVGSLSWDEESTARLKALLFGEALPRFSLPAPKTLAPGKAEGILLGGNLSLVASLVGTPYLPSLRGAILFLEEIDEKPYRVDRMLTQLILAGVLDEVAGVLVGQFSGCVDPSYPRPTWEEVVAERLANRGVPVLGGYPGGHEKVNWPLLVGAPAAIDADEGTVELKARLG